MENTIKKPKQIGRMEERAQCLFNLLKRSFETIDIKTSLEITVSWDSNDEENPDEYESIICIDNKVEIRWNEQKQGHDIFLNFYDPQCGTNSIQFDFIPDGDYAMIQIVKIYVETKLKEHFEIPIMEGRKSL